MPWVTHPKTSWPQACEKLRKPNRVAKSGAVPGCRNREGPEEEVHIRGSPLQPSSLLPTPAPHLPHSLHLSPPLWDPLQGPSCCCCCCWLAPPWLWGVPCKSLPSEVQFRVDFLSYLGESELCGGRIQDMDVRNLCWGLGDGSVGQNSCCMNMTLGQTPSTHGKARSDLSACNLTLYGAGDGIAGAYWLPAQHQVQREKTLAQGSKVRE